MIPPTTRSAISVVLTSTTASTSRSSTSFSIARPPVPVAWKTRQSQRSATASVTAVTHGVVTPNIVSPSAGLSWASGTGAAMAPPRACAALDSTRRLMRLSPATSVTEYMSVRSTEPTYGATFPEATVDTTIFGTPTGRRCSAGVTRAVPPDPPSASTPARSSRAGSHRSSASLIADTELPRSPVNASAPATSRGPTSAVRASGSEVPTSTVVTSWPASRRSPAT